MNTFDLNVVRSFVAAAHAGTMTAAAKDLNLPTSTVSRSVTRLEKHLKVLLVRRTSKGVVLTDSGKEYLHACKRALRALKEGSELVESHRSSPRGVLKIACPITMARDVLSPLLKEFLVRYPQLRVEVEPYASGWDQEPGEDIDIFFKLRAPRNTGRRVRVFPGTARGLFASHGYLATAGTPAAPEDLVTHSCIGAGTWTLTRGKRVETPDVLFRVVASDPGMHLKLVLDGVGIAILPLWMAKQGQVRNAVVAVLPQWRPEPISVCAIFSAPSRLTPKVQALLDFLTEYMGTDRDPRLQTGKPEVLFTYPTRVPASGP
jgi:LysR family transcriptional regulator, transcriptional activator for dmlA